ncbi:MAG: deoxyhypusine synthase [Candidatus Brocadia fulgida]|jgi:Deoxyhypusine synthase|uniref:Deoxyhypusine synthase n=1 Tax=Candidatus Brocadia fulgida TaxID=380242 RepID=A0A0M2V136_9BACT|nr:MAG: deoxyhypusine synthase [Candidatus Brocadia fulgida]
MSMSKKSKQCQLQHKYLCKPRITPQVLKKGMKVKDLVDEYSRSGAFNAGRLAEACKLYSHMIDEGATIGLTLSGAMTPTGMGGVLIALLENGFVDFIISTGANLYHDLHFALDLPIHQGDFRVDDTKLYEAGIERIYDIFITDELLFKTDKFIQDVAKKNSLAQPVSTADFHYMLGKAVLSDTPSPQLSFVAQAARYDVPVFVSSPGDSSIGMNLSYLKIKDKGITIDTDLDVLQTTAIVFSGEKNGVVSIGGGSPKNFYMQTQPTLAQILDIHKGGHDYFIQITTDAPQWGGLSGATPTEAISWGKIRSEEVKNHVVVYSDATIAMPIIAGYVMSEKKSRKKKYLYKHLPAYMTELKNHVK